MTTYHPTSCTECEKLKLGDCATCDMAKWRTTQNALAFFIAAEMILALTAAVYYFTYMGSYLESFMRYGDSAYAAKIAAGLTFAGMIGIFLLREKLTAWVEYMGYLATIPDEEEDEEEEDEDDEE